MKKIVNKPIVVTSLILAVTGYVSGVQAHSGGGTMGKNGTNPSATAVAFVTCFDDGNGVPDHLIANIKDMSEPVPGLLLSLQIVKGGQATNVTDPVSGDADPSPFGVLYGGPGVYTMLANTTAAGARKLSVTWHCETADDIHTGTQISVKQFQQ